MVHNEKILIAFLLLLTGVYAGQDNGLPSCWFPGILEGTSDYEYADGLNNTDHFDGSYSVNESADELNITVLQRLGASDGVNRMAQKYAMHYENYTGGGMRGLAYLFYNNNTGEISQTTTGRYYAVFQYENKVWGIANLIQDHNESSYWYENGVEAVFFFDMGSTNVTAIKISKMNYYDTGGQTWINYSFYRYGNASAFNISDDFSGGPAGVLTFPAAGATYEGYEWRGHNTGSAAGACQYSQYITLGNDTDTTVDPYAAYRFFNIPSDSSTCSDTGATDEGNYTHYYEIDYWNCQQLTGNVSFSALPGSDGCASGDYVPAIDCCIAGYCDDIPAGGETQTTAYDIVPSYYYAPTYSDGDCKFYEFDKYYDPDYDLYPMNQLGFYTLYNYPSNIYFLQTAPRGQGCDEDYSCGTANGSDVCGGIIGAQLEDYMVIARLPYDLPTGTMNSIEENATIINTTVNFAGLKTACRYWDPFNTILRDCPEYNMTVIMGINATQYQKNKAVVSGGIAVITTTYSNNLSSLLDTATERVFFDRLSTVVTNSSLDFNDYYPFLTRFMFVGVDYFPGTSPIYEGDSFATISGYNMSYNLTSFNYSSGLVTGIPYGTYQYSCPGIPSGYEATGTSGWVTIDEPIEFVTVYLQQIINLWLEVNLLKNGVPAPNVQCLASNADPVSDMSDSNGICNFTTVSYNSTVTVRAISGTNNVFGYFPIGDYVNSQQYGAGGSCQTFTGAYKYYWPIDSELAWIRIYAHEANSDEEIDGVTIYWDGELGSINMQKPWNFTIHNLTVIKDGYDTVMMNVDLSDYSYTVEYWIDVPMFSNSEFTKTDLKEEWGTVKGTANLFGNPLFLGVVLFLTVGGIGFMKAGIFGGAAALAGSALMLSWVGFFPWSYTVIVVLLAALLAAAGGKDVLAGVIGKR